MTTTMTRPRKARSGGISLSTTELKAALAAVKAAVPGRAAKPILLNVLLAEGSLTASDLELQIVVPLDYHGEPILLPYSRLAAIMAAAHGDEVTIESRGSNCVVSVGGGTWTLPTESAAEFPAWTPSGLRPICRMPGDQFRRAIRAVVYAAEKETSRYALGSVLVDVDREEGKFHFVGTDGRRLACYSMGISNQCDPDSCTTLISEKAAACMAALAHGADAAVSIDANASECVATIDGIVVTSRLVDGRFPKWRDVFPTRSDVDASVIPVAELLSATRQAAIVTSEQSRGVTYAITAEGLHLTARSSEAGESSVTCPVSKFGQAAVVKLDPRFVCELLNSVDMDEPLEVEAVDGSEAVVFRSGDDHRAVIMPLADE